MDASNTPERPTVLASIGRRLAARVIDCASVRSLADIYDNGRG
ncbi:MULTISPECIES: hypothetical protein [Pseudomonas]|jgi:hypothetical protein|nr:MULTISPECIES: hypothetical protein [Pseudomonas]WLG57085.1 hypothetical protein PSH77_00835 [Pseudomonas extremorientalis]